MKDQNKSASIVQHVGLKNLRSRQKKKDMQKKNR